MASATFFLDYIKKEGNLRVNLQPVDVARFDCRLDVVDPSEQHVHSVDLKQMT